jgi:hypothetical protein
VGGALRYQDDDRVLVWVRRRVCVVGDVQANNGNRGRYVQLQPSDWMYAQVAGSSFCLAWPVATVCQRPP